MAVVKKMTENEKKLFELFKNAVEAERQGQSMYKEAMALCDDPVLKDILNNFYQDEVRHEKEILARYKQFREEFSL